MKKWIWLFTSALFCILILLWVGNLYINSVEHVKVFTVKEMDGYQYVNCSGFLERKGETNVYVKSISLIDAVKVKTGTKVKTGDVLFTSYSATGTASGLSYIDETLQNTYAPVSGTIVAVGIEDGDFVNPGEKTIVIAQNGNMQVRLSVNESNISQVKTGQEAIITGSGFLSTYQGNVSRISEEAIQASVSSNDNTTVEVLVDINGAQAELKPGLSANVKIVTLCKSGCLVVPYECVKADDLGNEYVYTLKDGTATYTPIKTGDEFYNGFEILDGLSENDLVIQTPDLVSAGEPVKID